ncbi:MAG TPA: ABC transporter substrate-binding protein [Salinisphaeraceae bacterium]|nr:ABC transporter substrate-binding protein [Salinisphaeraceae bacterium]
MPIVLMWVLLACAWAVHADGALDTQRVVVAGGGLTATLYALGVEDHIVAVDSSSRWPPATAEKPQVGYMRALTAEGVLSLSPTLVLASGEAGPASVLHLIEAAGVPVRQLPAPRSAADVRTTIHTLARLFERPARGCELIEHLDAALAQARDIVAGYDEHPRVLFVLSADGQLLTAGRDTAAHAMIELAGGRNITDYTGYKPLTPEAAVELAPDVILTGDHVIVAMGSRQALLAKPALALTPAGRHGRLLVMDSLRLLGFGPRLGETVARLARQLHEQP